MAEHITTNTGNYRRGEKNRNYDMLCAPKVYKEDWRVFSVIVELQRAFNAPYYSQFSVWLAQTTYYSMIFTTFNGRQAALNKTLS